ncbi:MAG: phage holin family protein [Pseudonocardiaceae bacterium]
MTSTQRHRNGRHAKHAKPDAPRAVPSLPLSPEPVSEPSQTSLGELVREATTHLSTLLRSEVELAKAELTAEVRKGVKGSIMFIVALAILLFSLVFLFIALGEVIDIWLPRWASFSVVFGVMVLSAAGFALLGWRRVRSLHKPERTITTVRETGEVLTHLRPNHQHADQQRGGPQFRDPQFGGPQFGDAQFGGPLGEPHFGGPQRGDRHRVDRHPDPRKA